MAEADVLLQAERDALGLLGVLSHAYLTWDPPVPAGTDGSGHPDFTHFRGLNIQAVVIDNTDGEVLALEKNSIHETEDPSRHAEPAALRAAVGRLRAKRPRSGGTSVENYYRSQLFYADSDDETAYARTGCTLITSLEPCPMCASTLCVSRMKRVAYVIADQKFGGAWPLVKEKFYKSYKLTYGPLGVPAQRSPWLDRVHEFFQEFTVKVNQLRGSVQDTWFLDRFHDDLEAALTILSSTKPTDLGTTGADRAISERTLGDLKRLCRLPS